jgi:hypothetical protein
MVALDFRAVNSARKAWKVADRAASEAAVKMVGTSGAARDQAAQRLAEAVAQERTARAAIDAASAALLAAAGGAGKKAWSALVGTIPIVMFPVRLETRFKGDALWVRIYPDEILIDTVERSLTEQEIDAARGFWLALWPFLTTNRDAVSAAKDAWNAAVRLHTPERLGLAIRLQVPENLGSSPSGSQPVFPDVEIGAGVPTRAATTRLLPEHWVVRGYDAKGQQLFEAVSKQVTDVLAVSASPRVAPTTPGATLDADAQWTVDFAAAEQAGMALRIPLPSTARTGFARLLVTGLKVALETDTWATEGSASSELARLFEGHRFGAGLGLLPRWTPTNNSAQAPSPYPFPPPDDLVAALFSRKGHLEGLPIDRDTTRFAQVFQLPWLNLVCRSCLSFPGTDLDEVARSKAINELTWPFLYGGAFEEYWSQDSSVEYPDDGSAPQPRRRVAPDDLVRDVRQFFVEYVHPSGQYPFFRVGNAPYAILPTTSISLFESSKFEGKVAHVLRLARPTWMRRIGLVPRIYPEQRTNADNHALSVFRTSPRSNDLGWGVRALDGTADEDKAFIARLQQRFRTLFPAAGVTNGPALRSYVGRKATAGGQLDALLPFFQIVPWIPDKPLPADFWKAFNERPPFTKPGSTGPSLDSLLTENTPLNLLQEFTWARFVAVAALCAESQRVLRQLLDTPGYNPGLSAADRRATAMGAFTTPRWQGDSSALALRAAWRAFDLVTTMSGPELSRRMRDSVDLASYRIDAWLAALPLRRLYNQQGRYIGCFGWLEDLRPRTAPPSAGFLIAPSMAHAATAAVLLDGARTRAGDDRTFQVDLSSGRVRSALALLDSVRAGEPLASSVGRTFETALAQAGAFDAIERLRSKYPGHPPGAVTNGVGVILDGLALHKALGDPAQVSQLGLDAQVIAVLKKADATVASALDAVGDLGIAESVFQIVQGRPTTAGDLLERLARGEAPPPIDIVHSPRIGTQVAERVILRMNATAQPAGWPSSASARARVASAADRWAGGWLGDPRAAGWDVELTTGATKRVTIADLGLRPLDWIDIVRTTPPELFAEARTRDELAATPLGRRLLRVAGAPARSAKSTVSLARALAKARTLASLFGRVRPLVRADLEIARGQAPSDVGNAAPTGPLNDAHTALVALTTPPSPGTPRATLIAKLDAATQFTFDAQIAGDEPDDIMFAACERVARAMSDRLRHANEIQRPPEAPSSWVAGYGAALFGSSIPVTLAVTLADPSSVTAALSSDQQLFPPGERQRTVTRWCAMVARARPALDPLRNWLMLGEGSDLGGHDLRVVQLPLGGNGWAATSKPAGTGRVLSATIIQPRGLDDSATIWEGCVLDEWTETVPPEVMPGGLAFHYDDSSSEAAQCVLVAVHPRAEAPDVRWDADTLFTVLGETLDHAKLRLVDRLTLTTATADTTDDDHLVAHLLPSTYASSSGRTATALFKRFLA